MFNLNIKYGSGSDRFFKYESGSDQKAWFYRQTETEREISIEKQKVMDSETERYGQRNRKLKRDTLIKGRYD